MSEENCIMCQKSIGKEENKWALQIRSSIWIHYHCLENLWSSFNATPFQKQLRAENERLREALKEIIALDDGNSILKYYERYYQVFRLARQALKEVKE